MEVGLLTDAAAALDGARAQRAAHLARGHRSGSGSAALAAASEMEALFATQLVKEMRRSLGDGFFGGGAGADTMEGWLDEHLGAALGASGALGLAEAIEVSLQHKLQAASREEAA